MESELTNAGYRNQEFRAHQRRKDGVRYKLRVIEQSGGMLELVEEAPKEPWFVEWARVMHAMQRSGWGI